VSLVRDKAATITNRKYRSGAAIQQYWQSAFNYLRNPSFAGSGNPQSWLSQVRNLSTAQLIGAGVVAAEVLGFFTVGEIVGRFKLIGYRTSKPHGEH